MLYTVHGWDLSGWDNPIDWVKVAAWCKAQAFTLDFCFIKISEGTGYLSPVFNAQWAAVEQLNPVVARSAYHYILPLQDGKSQATYFLAHYLRGEMPPAVDIEDPGVPGTPTPAMAALAASNIYAFVDTVEQAIGRRMVGYTNNSWWMRIATQPLAQKVAGMMDFWGAEYHSLGGNLPVIPAGFDKTHGCTMWQFTSQLVVDGIGNVDESVYFGDLVQFRAWAGMAPVVTPPPVTLTLQGLDARLIVVEAKLGL